MDFLCFDEQTGAVEIVIDREPSFRAEFVVPAPKRTPDERARIVRQAKDSIWLRGLYIAETRPTHNPAFDDEDEQTSTMIVARPCMDTEEALEVERELNRILYERTDNC